MEEEIEGVDFCVLFSFVLLKDEDIMPKLSSLLANEKYDILTSTAFIL